MQLLFVIMLFFAFPLNVHAISNPTAVPNNRYGIHITDLNDISEAAKLVNTSRGDWGYVTVVIQDNDMNRGKWQEVFNALRRNHLIPLVRIATHAEGDAWKIPEELNIAKWTDFLNALNWPVANRYVILFNEPNHANEWGNTIDPAGYGDMLIKFSKALKAKSDDFFILPAGLDASAANTASTMDEQTYLTTLFATHPDVASYIDGWTSHAYPNPAFSGSPTDVGKGTLATFRWEKTLLGSFGVTKNLPVFITETGWEHSEGKYVDNRMLSADAISEYIKIASLGVWSDPSIVAITPFIINYQDNPFDHFSWKKLHSSDYYPFYETYKNIEKTAGAPIQHESFMFQTPFLPTTLVVNSTYRVEGMLKNTGQSILDPANGYTVSIRDESNMFDSFVDAVPVIEPDGAGKIQLLLKTPKQEGEYPLSVVATHGNTRTVIETKTLHIIPPPSADISIKLGWRKDSNNQTATVLVYDTDDELIHKFTDISIQNGHLTITGLYQVTPGKHYRVVVLVPYYLPRQAIVMMAESGNVWQIKRLYPFDFNRDGKLSLDDIPALLFMKPIDVINLFLHA